MTKRLRQNRLVMQCMAITCDSTDESAGQSEFMVDFCSQIGTYVTDKVQNWALHAVLNHFTVSSKKTRKS